MARKGTASRRYKWGIAVVAMGTLSSVCLVPHLVGRPVPKSGPTASSQLKRGGGTVPFHIPILLIATDGTLELYDQPGGALQEVLADQAVLASIVGGRNLYGHLWYRLVLADESEAWVIADDVAVEDEDILLFYDFQFCTGNAAAATGPCGNPIPLSTTGMWVSWKYQGVQQGDYVQWLLVVNGEQFTVPIDVWSGPTEGTRLINLMDAAPRPEPGLWTVKILVNGTFITEASITVQQ